MNTSAELPSRRHHYTFAHATLRDCALAAPERLLSAAIGGDLDQELRSLWRTAGADLPVHERLPDAGLAGRLIDDQSVLVTLPAALRPLEAHFVLVTAPLGGPVRYATLEESYDPATERPAAMLALWAMTASGPVHASTLQYLPAREDRFLDAAGQLPVVPPTLALS